MVTWVPEVFLAEVTSGSFCAGHHKDLTATGNRASLWHLGYLNGFVTEQFCSFFPRSFFRARSNVALPSPLTFFALLFCLFVFFFARFWSVFVFDAPVAVAEGFALGSLFTII